MSKAITIAGTPVLRSYHRRRETATTRLAVLAPQLVGPRHHRQEARLLRLLILRALRLTRPACYKPAWRGEARRGEARPASDPGAQPRHDVVHHLLLLGLDQEVVQEPIVEFDGLVRGRGLLVQRPRALGVGHHVVRAVQHQHRDGDPVQMLLQVRRQAEDLVACPDPDRAREHELVRVLGSQGLRVARHRWPVPV
uniref:Uncharacterized protein n=1 Tax=Arundo donax TaxID=35708 RepID=A0A0A9CSR0_ARUDO